MDGGCYCGALRFKAEGAPAMKAQCHCRECQYLTGGGPNFFMLMPPDGFAYVKGAPKSFTRTDIENAVTREFCETCGTQIATRRPGLPFVILKAGVLDDPKAFDNPAMAIFTIDKQPFHVIAEGMPSFERLPPR